MIAEWLESIREGHLISIGLLLIVLLSVLQGWIRGLPASAGRLASFLGSGLATLGALVLAVPAAAYLSPMVRDWAAQVEMPEGQASAWAQLGYTLASSLADSPLLRYAAVLLVVWSAVRLLIRLLLALLPLPRRIREARRPVRAFGFSRLGGAAVGLLIGAARGIVVVAALFVGIALNPDSTFSRYVEASPVYRQSADAVIQPVAGRAVQEKLPVLTKTVAEEMQGILSRRYEVVDREIPADIEGAAQEIAGDAGTAEEKARRLYDWIGSRVVYDHEKADNYEQHRIWKEQTPQDTFDTRKGVCIDYARLYAVMARSLGLKVQVVTGRGYDGSGGYGPHAWNEVYLPEQEKWIPLDATWAVSGDWFNPPEFDKTHVRESAL